MENPIKKEDVIDSAGILEEIGKIVDAIKNQLIPAMDLIVSQAKEEKEALAKLSPARKEDQVIIAEKVQVIQQLDAEQKKNKQTLTEVQKLEKQLQDTWKDSAVNAERLRQQISQNKKANKDLVESEKYAKGSLADLRKQLIELQKAYIAADPNKAKGMVSGITALRKEVDKAEKAIGSHSRGVGNYKNNIVAAAKELFSFAGVAGIATGVMSKLKNAFFETEQGAKVTKQWGEGIKTFFQNFIKGDQLAGVKGLAAMQIAKELDEIRKGDRVDLVKIAELETEIAILRYKSADATLSEAEQLKNLNLAQERENELIAYKKADLQQELSAVEKLLTTRLDDTILLGEQARLTAELAKLEGDRNLRLETKSSALREKQQKRAEEEIAEQKQVSEAYMAAVQMSYATKVEVAKKADIEIDKINQTALIKNDDYYKEQTKRIEQAAQEAIEIEQLKAQNTQDIVNASFGLLSNVIDRNKQKELEAAGENADERARIEKDYAMKSKAIAISQAVISTSLAVLNALNTKPYLPLGPIMAASAAALGAIQIATIAATKFAEGGEVGGRPHSQGGTLIEAEKDEFIVRKKSASKYKGLLKAINEDDPMKIAEELRNGKFHTVWGGVSQSLSQVSKQDPYTRLMYEMMKRDIKTYLDSDGNTVIVEHGRKRVIKK